jgi:protein-S-isoprenylcysteine O-methyltransferase Ste14
LVAVGPCRHVCNPMICGVLAMLMALAIFWGSVALGIWTLIFLLINQIYFVMSEELGPRRRFGDSYVEYAKNVPRSASARRTWVQRPKPWVPTSSIARHMTSAF